MKDKVETRKINNYNRRHHIETGKIETSSTKCLVCNKHEEQHPKSTEYVCSGCCQTLLSASQEVKKEMYSKASTKQKEGLIMFIEEEEDGESTTRKPRRVKRKRAY